MSAPENNDSAKTWEQQGEMDIGQRVLLTYICDFSIFAQ